MKKFENAKVGGQATIATLGTRIKGIITNVSGGYIGVRIIYKGEPRTGFFTEGTGRISGRCYFRGVLVEVEYNEPDSKKEIILNALFTQTASLKSQYIAMTKEWAAGEYSRMLARAEAYRQMIYPDTATERKAYYREQRWYYAQSFPGVDKFVAKRAKEAEEHYTDSIKKLAYRIEQRNMNAEGLQIKTAHVGVNINTTFTDGVQTVRAFTIIAEGPIQRPHYRYLIK